MTTLPIRAPQMPQTTAFNIQPLAVFARIASFLGAVIDVFAEAQRQAAEARARYPFAD
jgi:hypothetical protein